MDSLNDLINLELNSAPKVMQNKYDGLNSNINLLTYSTLNTFHDCPRRWVNSKLTASSGKRMRIANVTFAFGHAVGAGVAAYDSAFGISGDKEYSIGKAIFAAFLAWDVELDMEERKGNSAGKSFAESVLAIQLYAIFHEEETPLSEYEVVKDELTFGIDFEDGYFYSGHIDEVLRNKYTGGYLVKENKTTGSISVDPASYSNSDQALSYSVAVDMLGGNDYVVLYTIYSSSARKWISYDFPKTRLAKANWIQDQLLIHQQLDSYKELNFYPTRGAACFSFFRRCECYETCSLEAKDVYGIEPKDLNQLKSLEELNKIESLDISVTLSALVAKQRNSFN